MWKEVLDFDMQAKEGGNAVKELVAGKTFERPIGGFVAIVNVGRVDNWLGHDLAMANLYGFGRLAWDPNLTSKAIAEEWTRLTFGHDPLVVGALVDMLLKSWRIYENYTGPLGRRLAHRSWRRAVRTGHRVGRSLAAGRRGIAPTKRASARTAPRPPAPASSLNIRTDRRAIRVARNVSRIAASVHAPVPYTHMLKSGKTVIQHIYDAHYEGARDAARLVQQWQSLKGHVDDERYEAVLARLQYQAGHAKVWRDAVCTWFLHKSGIADNEGRVGNYPNRFEAEAMNARRLTSRRTSRRGKRPPAASARK